MIPQELALDQETQPGVTSLDYPKKADKRIGVLAFTPKYECARVGLLPVAAQGPIFWNKSSIFPRIFMLAL